jgi:undecaprenyl diphosphate synthase
MGGRKMFSLCRKKNKDNRSIYDKIDMSKLPGHIAIIMDGNGRWARTRNLPRAMGHRAGVETIREIVSVSSELGIKVLTLYAFSTENWKRPTDEVNALMNLLVEYLRKEVRELHEKKVRIMAIGNIAKLPEICQHELNKAIKMTSKNTGLILNLALNYGGRSEIIDAVRKICISVQKEHLKPEEIDEKIISEYLSTGSIPDPDLIVRPSGELRLSNFLLWQCAYSEFWFSDINWPDFKKEHLFKAIYDYQQRDRRFGGIKR